MGSDRDRQLAEEFHRALADGPECAPWGLTPDRVLELRIDREDLELWLLETLFNGASSYRRLSSGRKGYFTRTFNPIWMAIQEGWAAVDSEGRPGYYRAWTRNANFGVIWARDKQHAANAAELIFRHVADRTTTRYGLTRQESGRIYVSFLGGSTGDDEESALRKAAQDIEQIEQEVEVSLDRIKMYTKKVEELRARADAIRSAMLVLPPAATGDE